MSNNKDGSETLLWVLITIIFVIFPTIMIIIYVPMETEIKQSICNQEHQRIKDSIEIEYLKNTNKIENTYNKFLDTLEMTRPPDTLYLGKKRYIRVKQ